MGVVRNSQGIISGPIPGQSWTDEPGKHPWERPPQFVKPDDAVEYIWKRLMRKDVFVQTLAVLEHGASLTHTADTMLYSCVMSGLFTLDTAFIIRDVIVSMLAIMSKKAGITPKLYEDGVEKFGVRQFAAVASDAEAAKKANAIPDKKESKDALLADVKKATAGLLKSPTEGMPNV